jgi:SET domain-containing protein
MARQIKTYVKRVGVKHGGARTVVRNSPVHGRGVFARVAIRKGARLLEYKGRRISEAAADERYPDDDSKPAHTFLFLLDDGTVIDANFEGNSARWINHSCDPNCETEEDENGHVWIDAIRYIRPGEELFYDYNLVLDEPLTPLLKERYRCRCRSGNCRGTLFGKRRYRPPAKPAPKADEPAVGIPGPVPLPKGEPSLAAASELQEKVA